MFVLSCLGQTTEPSQAPPPQAAWAQLSRNPELMNEFGRLYQRMLAEVKFPPARSGSRLLPLVPASSVFYAASSNYGEAAHQAVGIFREELQRSPALQQWWAQGDVAKNGPEMLDALEKYYRISQYLGDEIVVAGGLDGTSARGLMVAEIRKPGLKDALQQVLNGISAKNKPQVKVLDPQEFAAMPAKPSQDLLVLVRPDYVVVSPDAAALRSFNARLDSGSRNFVTTPFAQRIAEAYRDGVTTLGAVDLRTLVGQAPVKSPQDEAALQRTGFGDVQYLVWEHTKVGEQEISQSELSFNGQRHGIAAWLGAPAQLGGLDFVSPKAMMALSLVLANPAQIYDDARMISTATNPNGFAAINQMEQAYRISFRDDLLGLLGGEITLDFDSLTPAPVWKAIVQVKDAAHMQRTIETLAAAGQLRAEEYEEGGVTYHVVRVPGGRAPAGIAYAFVDGYLLVGSSSEEVKEAVQVHRTGDSLGKSAKFKAALPPGHPQGVSGLVYEDPVTMASLQMQQIAPEMAGSLGQLSGQTPPLVMAAYGEEKAIRGASTSQAMDAGMIMVVAAIAIPNLLRSRMAANEATAVGMVRTLNTAEVTYKSMYPDRGFAPNLATLGVGPGKASPDHAGLIDATLGCSSSDGWCEKSGYRFRITPVCYLGQCPQYVAVATPVNSSTGSRSFCSTADGSVHFQVGPPVMKPPSMGECKAWPALR